MFSLGVVFFSIGDLGLGLTTDHTAAWLQLAACGAFTALTDGVGKAWISRLVPDTDQGTAQGLYQGSAGVGVLIAGIWTGLAWNQNGQLPPIIAGLVLAVAIPLVTRPNQSLAAHRAGCGWR